MVIVRKGSNGKGSLHTIVIIHCLSRRASEALLCRSCSESWLSHWRTALSLWRRTFLADGLIQCRRRFEEGP